MRQRVYWGGLAVVLAVAGGLWLANRPGAGGTPATRADGPAAAAPFASAGSDAAGPPGAAPRASAASVPGEPPRPVFSAEQRQAWQDAMARRHQETLLALVHRAATSRQVQDLVAARLALNHCRFGTLQSRETLAQMNEAQSQARQALQLRCETQGQMAALDKQLDALRQQWPAGSEEASLLAALQTGAVAQVQVQGLHLALESGSADLLSAVLIKVPKVSRLLQDSGLAPRPPPQTGLLSVAAFRALLPDSLTHVGSDAEVSGFLMQASVNSVEMLDEALIWHAAQWLACEQQGRCAQMALEDLGCLDLKDCGADWPQQVQRRLLGPDGSSTLLRMHREWPQDTRRQRWEQILAWLRQGLPTPPPG